MYNQQILLDGAVTRQALVGNRPTYPAPCNECSSFQGSHAPAVTLIIRAYYERERQKTNPLFLNVRRRFPTADP